MRSIPQFPTGAGPSSRSAAAAAAFVVAVLLILLAPAAGAETSLEVQTSAGNFGAGNSGTVVLLVTITADGAVEGELKVSAAQVLVASQPVEVPGGSSKTVALTVPSTTWEGYEVSFAAPDADDSATVRFNLREAEGNEIVAVFPAVAGRGMPETADLSVDVGQARLFAFDPRLLDFGGGVLNAFSYAIAAPADLQQLSETALADFFEWVSLDGGSLVLTAEPGDLTLPAGLALEFPGDDQRLAWLGLGNVVFAGDELDGGYDGFLAPLPTGPNDEGQYWVDSWIRTEGLARDAGVRVASIGVLVIVLGVYAILAGPVLWLALRRRSREPLLWLALPVLAIVVTGVLYGVGRQLRDAASTAHASIAVDVGGRQYSASYVLVTSPHGGSAGVTLAPGWSPLTITGSGLEVGFDSFGPDVAVSSAGGSVGSDRRLLLDLEPGGIGIVPAQASAPASGSAFSVTTRIEDNVLVADVVNQSPYHLHEVVIGTSGDARKRAESMAPGESWSVRLPLGVRFGGFGDPFFEQVMWGASLFEDEFLEEGGSGPDDPAQGRTSPAILGDFLIANLHLRRDGLISVVGWTREPEGPLKTHNGETVETGSTALMTVQRYDTAGSDGSNEVSVLRDHSETSVIDEPGVGGCAGPSVTLRIGLVGGFATGEIPVLDLFRSRVTSLDVWVGDSWVPAGLSELAPDSVIELPAESVVDDAVHVRLVTPCDFFDGQANTAAPELRPRRSDDDTVVLGELPADSDQAEQEAQ